MPRRASSSTTGWWTDAITSRDELVGAGHRRVGAHAAGVRAGVALADPLVVAGGRERDGALAVAERKQRQLLAGEELLHHHGLVAEPACDEHVLERGARLVLAAAITTPLPAASPSALITAG